MPTGNLLSLLVFDGKVLVEARLLWSLVHV
jgi:hypothetical protein